MKIKNWFLRHKIVSIIMFVIFILCLILIYDILNSGETTVRVLEVNQRGCNLWERIIDFWPDEDGCKVDVISEVEQ